MLAFPNAKINIGLRVTEKRTDNYHNIETVFYPLALCDALEVITRSGFPSGDKTACAGPGAAPACNPSVSDAAFVGDLGGFFSASGIVVDTPAESNLTVKAYRLLQRDFELPAVDVHLHKQIPFGAGLGGGSADAAFMLKMLNKMFALKIPIGQLEHYASMLGADCAFFVRNKPVFATGIGNVFQHIDLNLEKYHIALVKPPIFVSTVQAYAGIKPQMPETSLAEIVRKPLPEWKNCLVNDFEQSVFAEFPAISDVKNELYNQGAIYASMSGSGSSVYGIFLEKQKLKDVFPADYCCFGC